MEGRVDIKLMSQYLKGSISGLNRSEEHDCRMTIVIHCNLVMNPCIDLNDTIFINLIELICAKI